MFKYLEERKKLFVYTPLVLYWIVLFIATTIPASSVPDIGVTDKFNHFAAYFILAVLLFLVLLFQQKYSLSLKAIAVYTILICSLYGMLDEIHQAFIPGRNAEFLDWAADTAGALLGVLIMLILIKNSNYKIKSEQLNN